MYIFDWYHVSRPSPKSFVWFKFSFFHFLIDFPIYQGGFISGIRSEQGGEILTRASEEGGNMGKWARGEIFTKCDKMWEMWENNGEIEHGSFHRSFSVGNYI